MQILAIFASLQVSAVQTMQQAVPGRYTCAGLNICALNVLDQSIQPRQQPLQVQHNSSDSRTGFNRVADSK